MLYQHLLFHFWASRELLKAVEPLSDEERSRDLGTSYGSILGTLHHIYWADKVWLLRISFPYNLAPKPELHIPSFDDLLGLWIPLMQQWEQWGKAKADVMANERIAHMTTEGKRYEHPIGEVVMHVVNHGSYHRGQVATLLRQLGYVPPKTDLIHYYRLTRKSEA